MRIVGNGIYLAEVIADSLLGKNLEHPNGGFPFRMDGVHLDCLIYVYIRKGIC